MIYKAISGFLGDVVIYGGGTVVISFLVFKFFGEKLIDGHFNKKIEAFKHLQAKEIENLKFRINAEFNRISKVQNKEYEVLPEIWFQLVKAMGEISDISSPIQEYLDIASMNYEQVRETLLGLSLADYKIKEVMEAKDKNKKFKQIYNQWRLKKTNIAISDFHNYLLLNKIFLSAKLFEKLSEIDQKLRVAWIKCKHQLYYKPEEFELSEKAYDLIQGTETIKEEIEKLIQEKLHCNPEF